MRRHERIDSDRLPRRLGKGTVFGLVLGLALMAAGCGDIFEVENPGSLLDEDLESPGLLESLGRTAEGNITGPYSDLNVRAGLLNGEIFHPSTQLENVDAMRGNRLASNSSVEAHWRDLAQARWLADEMVDRISELVENPGSDRRVAEAHFFGGLARITMADHYNVVVYGPEGGLRGPIDVLQDAIERFEAAATIAGAAGEPNLRAGALGQIARAYRSLYFEELHLRGNDDPSLLQQAEAAAREALAADPDYEIALQYGAPGPSNDMALLGGPFGGVNRMDESYLFVEDPVTGEWDPRLPHEEEVRTEPLGNTSFNLKFAAREAELPVSRAAEARLIIAEARLLAGGLDEAVDWINQVRAAARTRTSSGDWAPADRGWPPDRPLSDLSDFSSSDADEIYAQLKHERQAEFWLEMRRWQDMRYYEIMPYRWFDQNQAAGLQLRWPPAPEEISNNPNLTPDIARRVYVN